MTTETFVTPGQNTWVCPVGVSTVLVELWGGGGGGGGNAVASDGGGGGAAGGYGSVAAYAVTAGNTYTFFVGTGGPGVTSAAGTNGGVTWWRDATTFQVPGGPGGKVVAAGSPGGTTAGVATSDASFVGSFDVKKSGGTGGAGVNNNSGGGGGGGGSSGDTGSGGAGGTGTAGTGGAGGTAGTTNGGIGGDGGSGTANGIAPVSGNGGGGGGSGEGVVKGGDGAVGKIVLTYTAAGGDTGAQFIMIPDAMGLDGFQLIQSGGGIRAF